MNNRIPAPPDPQPQVVTEIHGWCPECKGAGMVMDIDGPIDCPNLNHHRLLNELEQGSTLLSRADAAALLGVSLKAMERLMDAELIPWVIVGKTYVFRYRDIQAMRAMIQAVL